MTDQANIIADALDRAAQTPQAVTIDGQSVTTRPIGDLIELDQHLAAKRAAAEGRLPMQMFRVVPPGGRG